MFSKHPASIDFVRALHLSWLSLADLSLPGIAQELLATMKSWGALGICQIHVAATFQWVSAETIMGTNWIGLRGQVEARLG